LGRFCEHRFKLRVALKWVLNFGVPQSGGNFEVRHPHCVSPITRKTMYYTYSETQLYLISSTVGKLLHWVLYNYI
jgi:hypothetical protein